MGQATHFRNPDHWAERTDIAAAFRWTARLNTHEAVANYLSLAVSDDIKWLLMNPNQRHFSRIKASDLLLSDSDNPVTMNQPNAPDPTAWGLHPPIHRLVPHARCAMHSHSIHAAVLACQDDNTLLPTDQNAATFCGRTAVDESFGGLTFDEEGMRHVRKLSEMNAKLIIRGSHGVLVVGSDVADAFNRLYHFVRVAGTYVRALQTGTPLRVLSRKTAERTAREIEGCPGQAERHLTELKAILDEGGSDYAT